MKLSGSQIILKVLKSKGVDTIFGYPGGAVIPFFDTLYDETQNFKIYRPAHEQNGVHSADGYARSTGKVGVFVGTSGPGATNTITGIATAYMDSIPILIITGQVPNTLIGKDSFQEIDITGMTLPITKHNYLIRKIDDLQETIENAFDVAKNGRPGPVLVDIPKDIFLSEYEYKENKNYNNKKNLTTNIKNIEQAINLINNSKKPIIYAGGGIRISKTDNLLTKFAEKSSIPVANSFMGLGTINRNHILSMGFLGMHGSKSTNLAVTKCDLLIAIGVRFNDRVIGNPNRFAPNANIIHIDIDNTEIDKNISNCIPLMGDFKIILKELIDKVNTINRENWLNEINTLKINEKITNEFTPNNIIKTINKFYNKNTILVTDVGQHQMWCGQYWKFQKSNEFITSGGLGTMGFGIGAAIGAQIGNTNKNTILITGDGSFRMSSQELVTISTYNIPIRIIMFNNGTLGMVRQWQKLFHNKRYSQTDLLNNVNYKTLVSAYNIQSYCIKDINNLEKYLSETINIKSPIFFECIIDKDYNVFPMVPPGKPIDEIMLND